MTSPRLFPGHRPKRGKELAIIGRFSAFQLPTSVYPWASLKVVAAPGVMLPKANYRLAWSAEERRFATTPDAARLAQDHPRVYRGLQAACIDLIDPSSLPRRKAPRQVLDELVKLRGELASVLARVDAMLEGKQ